MDLKDPQIPSLDEKHQCFRGVHYSPKLGVARSNRAWVTI